MARLPNSAKAILDVRKLQDYCLSPTHLRGRHKARTFQATLGIGQKDAVWLREALLEAASTESAIRLAADDYGERWRIDLRLTRQGLDYDKNPMDCSDRRGCSPVRHLLGDLIG